MDTARPESYYGEFAGIGSGSGISQPETVSQHVNRIFDEDTPEGDAMRREIKNGADEIEAVLRTQSNEKEAK